MVKNFQRAIPISLTSARGIVEFLSDQKELFLSFVGKKKISELHSQYFDDPSATDCITIAYDDPKFLGEIFVCPQIAKEYIKKHGGDLEKEITLYIIHGFLHLLGYTDTTQNARKEMQTAEKKWMKILAKNNLGIKLC